MSEPWYSLHAVQTRRSNDKESCGSHFAQTLTNISGTINRLSKQFSICHWGTSSLFFHSLVCLRLFRSSNSGNSACTYTLSNMTLQSLPCRAFVMWPVEANSFVRKVSQITVMSEKFCAANLSGYAHKVLEVTQWQGTILEALGIFPVNKRIRPLPSNIPPRLAYCRVILSIVMYDVMCV